MKLTLLRRESGGDVPGCADGRTCPAVRASDRDTIVITGKLLTDPGDLAQAGIAPGEAAVEIPASLLPEVLPHDG